MPGIFLQDFSGHFSHKNEERKSCDSKSVQKRSGGSKRKIREKSVLPRTGPGVFELRVSTRAWRVRFRHERFRPSKHPMVVCGV